jgi:hypothetical protein
VAGLQEQVGALQEVLTSLVTWQSAAIKEQAERRAELAETVAKQAKLQAEVRHLTDAVERLAENVEGLGRGGFPVLITTQLAGPQPADEQTGSQALTTGITLQPVRPRLQLGEPEPTEGEKVLKLDL